MSMVLKQQMYVELSVEGVSNYVSRELRWRWGAMKCIKQNAIETIASVLAASA